MKQDKLRVGLLLGAYVVDAWQYEMLKRIQKSDYAEVVLVIFDGTVRPKRNIFTRLKDNWRYILPKIYYRLERRRFRSEPDAFASRDIKTLIGDLPFISVEPEQTEYSDRIKKEDVDEIKAYELDVLIRSGFRILRGDILRVPRYGIWSYHHGDSEVNRGGPAGFWEVFESQPTTGSVLQILTEDLDNGIVLYKSYSATDTISVERNRNRCFWKSLSFLPRTLRELNRVGPDKFFEELTSSNRGLTMYSSRLYKSPENFEFIRILFIHLIRAIKHKLAYFIFFDQWLLMYDMRDNISTSFWRFKKLYPPKDRFWADPHAVFAKGIYYIFLEEFIHGEGKAHIALMEIDQHGSSTKPQRIISQPYHLSNPFIFEWDDNYYMIPETSSNRSVEVYLCKSFPDQWVFYKTLMKNIHAVDATLFLYQDIWWLFANVKENEGASDWDELFLFYADHPLSDSWISHPKNPIVSDVRRARPAGKIFRHNGIIYRPSQDCSRKYGYGLKLNEITLLSKEEYQEVEASSIEPNWENRIIGAHTFNHVNELTIIDAQVKRPRI